MIGVNNAEPLMSQITIRCPNCSRPYSVQPEIEGKKVVCSNSECGTSFVANSTAVPPPVEYFKSFAPDGDVQKGEQSLESTPRVERAQRRLYRAARMVFALGAVFLLAGLACPTTIYSQGRALADSGYFQNAPLASKKEAALLAAICLMVTGAIGFSHSKADFSEEDFAFVCVVVIASVLILATHALYVFV
jgi:hypothetical protein